MFNVKNFCISDEQHECHEWVDSITRLNTVVRFNVKSDEQHVCPKCGKKYTYKRNLKVCMKFEHLIL